jgi:hypothetical protein
MKRALAKKEAFNQILKRLETPNAERLIEKARTANRLAKAAPDARARRRAYRVKVDALLNLRRCFPTHTSGHDGPTHPILRHRQICLAANWRAMRSARARVCLRLLKTGTRYGTLNKTLHLKIYERSSSR